ncbi:MAG: nodulation protein NfeD [Nitrospirae bacterium]|nr:nodulation protein NfeD [Nitrospirota bacterium]
MRIKTRHAVFIALILIIAGSFVLTVAADTKKTKKITKPTPPAAASIPSARKIHLIEIDAPITPVVAEYIIKSIDRASKAGAEALIIQLNTPGGLVDSTQQIVMKMMASEVPTVVYVAPSGGRAASAGVFITLAANIAAMAPTTHIGAAHPVQMQGKMDETMEKKAVNDLAAMMRGIAEKRGRNAKWAEDAVRQSVSITETEALKNKVIDFVAPDIASLVKAMDNKTVDVVIGKKTLKTAGAEVVTMKMGFRDKLLGIISNPNIAYILMILGFYGLYFELSNPGAIFPGVAGAICLILAFYALQTLPINYAGLMLIIFAIALFIAEAFITSHGVLGVGGTIAMLLGSVMLIDSLAPALQISWAVIIPVVAMSAILFIVTVTVAVRVHREKTDTGQEGLIGKQAEARSDLNPTGQVFVRGENWNARSNGSVQKGEKVNIVGIDGLTLIVKKAESSEK